MKISIRKNGRLLIVFVILVLFQTSAFCMDTSILREAVTVDGIRSHQSALQTIADANEGSRHSGFAGYNASADYVIEQLEAVGYAIEVQPFSFHDWFSLTPPTFEQTVPGMISYTEGEDFDLMSESDSGDITAPVTGVDLNLYDPSNSSSGCEPEDFSAFPVGHIALLQRGPCFFKVKAENAAAAGAVGVIVMNQGDSPNRMGLFFGTLSEDYSGGIPVFSTSFDLGVELANTAGLVMHMTSDVFRGDLTTSNIIAETPSGNPDKVVMAGAALDSSLTSPGINVNGSGVATLLEIAKQIANLGFGTENKLRFAFWGASQAGFIGSAYYADMLSTDEIDDIKMVLDFHALGSPNYVRFVLDGDGSEGGISGGTGSKEIEASFQNYFSDPLLGGDLASDPIHILSDVVPFADYGLPVGGLFGGILGIKTTEQAAIYGGVAGEQYDPCAYLACDTFDNVSLNGLDEMSDAAAHVILTYAMSTAGLQTSAVEELITETEDLGIPHGIENGLISKIEASLGAIEKGNEEAAINQLQAFINQVEAKRGSQLTDSEADNLIAMAQAIIDELI